MNRRPSPHDFLLALRGRDPALARRFDGMSGLALSGDVLTVRAPRGSWSEAELTRGLPALRAAAESFFGPNASVVLEPASGAPEALPFPILATKVWNHVAFWAHDGRRGLVLALRKPLYLQQWLPLAAEGDLRVARQADSPDVSCRSYPGGDPLAAVPAVLDDLCGLSREQLSYVQLVAPFAGDEAADRLEARWYAVKEWGTPRTPAAVFQKYVGRVHWGSPDLPPLGLRVARLLLEAVQ